MRKRNVLSETAEPVWAKGTDKLCQLVFGDFRRRGYWDAGIKHRPTIEYTAPIMVLLSTAIQQFCTKWDELHPEMPQYLKWQVHLADAIVHILDWCGAFQVDIGSIVLARVAWARRQPRG